MLPWLYQWLLGSPCMPKDETERPKQTSVPAFLGLSSSPSYMINKWKNLNTWTTESNCYGYYICDEYVDIDMNTQEVKDKGGPSFEEIKEEECGSSDR
jgi:hypothetical protein